MATSSPTIPNGSLPDPVRNWVALGLNLASCGLFAFHCYLMLYYKVWYPGKKEIKWKLDMISSYMLCGMFTVAQYPLSLVPQQNAASGGNVADPSLRGNQASDVLVANLVLGSVVFVAYSIVFAAWLYWKRLPDMRRRWVRFK